ncbi:ABC transporter substrate-binding protein [Litoribacillus peritrichatus]|uniref:ABC transporter substrate-binding protein n=1 Tax=Litoribacillus peritrichatus TaxID=718191 RepID=A0ABP7MDZ2_9GAMM
MTELDPPAQYYSESGELTGFGIEIVQEIQTLVGNSDPISVVPWARAYHMIETEDNVVLFLMARNQLRNEKFKWVGPVLEFSFGLYAKEDSEISSLSEPEARNLKSIGVYRNDVRDQILTQMGFENLKRVGDKLQNVKMLMTNRIDAYASSSLSYGIDASEAGYKESDLKLVMTFQTIQAYIAMSLNVPDHVVASWNSALKSMIDDGTYIKILKKYYPTANLPTKAITEFD